VLDTVSDNKKSKRKEGNGLESDGEETKSEEQSEGQKNASDNRLRELVVDNQIQEIVLKVIIHLFYNFILFYICDGIHIILCPICKCL
jgi:hypothetical protein